MSFTAAFVEAAPSMATSSSDTVRSAAAAAAQAKMASMPGPESENAEQQSTQSKNPTRHRWLLEELLGSSQNSTGFKY